MDTEALRAEIIDLVRSLDAEALARVAKGLRVPRHSATAPATPSTKPLASFNADGTGYTERELSHLLDAETKAALRGEGLITAGEFATSMQAWRTSTK